VTALTVSITKDEDVKRETHRKTLTRLAELGRVKDIQYTPEYLHAIKLVSQVKSRINKNQKKEEQIILQKKSQNPNIEETDVKIEVQPIVSNTISF